MARVQANRIWQHHFGQGIVATSENLGINQVQQHIDALKRLLEKLRTESGFAIEVVHGSHSAPVKEPAPAAPAVEATASKRSLWNRVTAGNR